MVSKKLALKLKQLVDFFHNNIVNTHLHILYFHTFKFTEFPEELILRKRFENISLILFKSFRIKVTYCNKL